MATTTRCWVDLKPGDRVIESGLQMIGEGAPVMPLTGPPPSACGSASGSVSQIGNAGNDQVAQRMRKNNGFRNEEYGLVDFFIRRPVFATVCALLIILAGAISIPTLPISQFPQLAPPAGGRYVELCGRECGAGRVGGDDSAGAVHQRR